MSKYNARKVTLDGIVFDSIAESRRYSELKLLEAAGEIRGLEVHKPFVLQGAAVRRGKKVRAITYEADFCYTECNTGIKVAEDVKGVMTAAFRLKQRMFQYWCDDWDLRVIKAR